MTALVRAAERLPNWLRAAAIVALPLLAYWAAATKDAVPSAVFVVWSAVTLFAHLPVFLFDGPLPVSSLGVHHSGEIHSWDEVAAVEPLGERDLRAVLADGRALKLRVKGRRTRDDLRRAIAAHAPDTIRF